MSECQTSPVATCNVANLKGFTGTIGLPVSSTEIAIRGENGADVPLGHAGFADDTAPRGLDGVGVLVAVLSSLIPSRRTSKLDPIEVIQGG